ncbi:hypothetical protein DFH06DRAFT_1132528 [Mycena polygramma]|nr:hypothetical protein DFH06DRAFT_1132528 [Mycena polygramma]
MSRELKGKRAAAVFRVQKVKKEREGKGFAERDRKIKEGVAKPSKPTARTDDALERTQNVLILQPESLRLHGKEKKKGDAKDKAKKQRRSVRCLLTATTMYPSERVLGVSLAYPECTDTKDQRGRKFDESKRDVRRLWLGKREVCKSWNTIDTSKAESETLHRGFENFNPIIQSFYPASAASVGSKIVEDRDFDIRRRVVGSHEILDGGNRRNLSQGQIITVSSGSTIPAGHSSGIIREMRWHRDDCPVPGWMTWDWASSRRVAEPSGFAAVILSTLANKHSLCVALFDIQPTRARFNARSGNSVVRRPQKSGLPPTKRATDSTVQRTGTIMPNGLQESKISKGFVKGIGRDAVAGPSVLMDFGMTPMFPQQLLHIQQIIVRNVTSDPLPLNYAASAPRQEIRKRQKLLDSFHYPSQIFSNFPGKASYGNIGVVPKSIRTDGPATASLPIPFTNPLEILDSYSGGNELEGREKNAKCRPIGKMQTRWA